MNTNEIFIDIKTLPKPLKKSELYKLLNEVKNGNKEAKKTIIEHNIRLVLFIVKERFNTVDYDKRDLVSIGNIGLIKATNTFDITKNIEFTTYATKCITNEILMFLKKLNKYQNIDSLNKIINIDSNGNELKIEDLLYDELNLNEEYIKNETYQFVRELVSNLKEKEKKIIIMYFGFDKDKSYTQKEISEKLNISQSYVSRIIKKSLNQIRTKLIANEFVEHNSEKQKIKIKKYNKANLNLKG